MNKYLIIDKNTISRETIASLISQMDNDSIVYEAENMKEARLISKYYKSIALVIINPGYDKESQLINLKSLKRRLADCSVLAITNYPQFDHIESMLRAGANSVVSLKSGCDELLSAIQSMHSVQSYVSQDLLNTSPKKNNKTNTIELENKDPHKNRENNLKLTNRQKQVLDCIVKGYANKLIAYDLGLAEGTVKIHVSSILRALNVKNRTEAAMLAKQALNPNLYMESRASK